MARQRRLTIPEAARLSGISDQLLRRYARSKRLRARLSDAGQWGVWLRDLQAFTAGYRPQRGRPRSSSGASGASDLAASDVSGLAGSRRAGEAAKQQGG